MTRSEYDANRYLADTVEFHRARRNRLLREKLRRQRNWRKARAAKRSFFGRMFG